MPNPRQRLAELAAERGTPLSDLSVLIGRNQAYLSQFITRGMPRKLPEDDRRHLAIVLHVDERELGARDPWVPAI